MAQTPSTMLPLGTKAPDFELPDADGRLVRLDDFSDARALLVAFICNHCPFVVHIEREFARLASDYSARGAAVVAITSNDTEKYPQDGPGGMREQIRRAGFTFDYLLDEFQEVAKAYQAACTPDFFLFDAGRRLVYRGQFDGSRPGNDVPVTGKDLRTALDTVLAGDEPANDQRPSIGCNIKWKPGNEPDWWNTVHS